MTPGVLLAWLAYCDAQHSASLTRRNHAGMIHWGNELRRTALALGQVNDVVDVSCASFLAGEPALRA